MSYETLPAALKPQLEAIPQLSGHGTTIHACAARLHSGKILPRLVMTRIDSRPDADDALAETFRNAFDMPAIIKKAASASGLDLDLEQLRSEDHKRNHEVLPSEVAELTTSDNATPVWLYERIFSFYETGMGYHIVSLQTKLGDRYTCLTYSPAFIQLPKDISFQDIVAVEPLSRNVSDFDCGDAGHWTCSYNT